MLKFEEMTLLQRRLHNAAIVLEAEKQGYGYDRLLRETLDKIQSMRDALEEAKNGLVWYTERHPYEADGSDDEAMTRIDEALKALGETPNGNHGDRQWTVVVWDGHSTNERQVKGTYEQVASMCRSMYPPGYIWTVS